MAGLQSQNISVLSAHPHGNHDTTTLVIPHTGSRDKNTCVFCRRRATPSFTDPHAPQFAFFSLVDCRHYACQPCALVQCDNDGHVIRCPECHCISRLAQTGRRRHASAPHAVTHRSRRRLSRAHEDASMDITNTAAVYEDTSFASHASRTRRPASAQPALHTRAHAHSDAVSRVHRRRAHDTQTSATDEGKEEGEKEERVNIDDGVSSIASRHSLHTSHARTRPSPRRSREAHGGARTETEESAPRRATSPLTQEAVAALRGGWGGTSLHASAAASSSRGGAAGGHWVTSSAASSAMSTLTRASSLDYRTKPRASALSGRREAVESGAVVSLFTIPTVQTREVMQSERHRGTDAVHKGGHRRTRSRTRSPLSARHGAAEAVAIKSASTRQDANAVRQVSETEVGVKDVPERIADKVGQEETTEKTTLSLNSSDDANNTGEISNDTNTTEDVNSANHTNRNDTDTMHVTDGSDDVVNKASSAATTHANDTHERHEVASNPSSSGPEADRHTEEDNSTRVNDARSREAEEHRSGEAKDTPAAAPEGHAEAHSTHARALFLPLDDAEQSDELPHLIRAEAEEREALVASESRARAVILSLGAANQSRTHAHNEEAKKEYSHAKENGKEQHDAHAQPHSSTSASADPDMTRRHDTWTQHMHVNNNNNTNNDTHDSSNRFALYTLELSPRTPTPPPADNSIVPPLPHASLASSASSVRMLLSAPQTPSQPPPRRYSVDDERVSATSEDKSELGEWRGGAAAAESKAIATRRHRLRWRAGMEEEDERSPAVKQTNTSSSSLLSSSSSSLLLLSASPHRRRHRRRVEAVRVTSPSSHVTAHARGRKRRDRRESDGALDLSTRQGEDEKRKHEEKEEEARAKEAAAAASLAKAAAEAAQAQREAEEQQHRDMLHQRALHELIAQESAWRDTLARSATALHRTLCACAATALAESVRHERCERVMTRESATRGAMEVDAEVEHRALLQQMVHLLQLHYAQQQQQRLWRSAGMHDKETEAIIHTEQPARIGTDQTNTSPIPIAHDSTTQPIESNDAASRTAETDERRARAAQRRAQRRWASERAAAAAMAAQWLACFHDEQRARHALRSEEQTAWRLMKRQHSRTASSSSSSHRRHRSAGEHSHVPHVTIRQAETNDTRDEDTEKEKAKEEEVWRRVERCIGAATARALSAASSKGPARRSTTTSPTPPPSMRPTVTEDTEEEVHPEGEQKTSLPVTHTPASAADMTHTSPHIESADPALHEEGLLNSTGTARLDVEQTGNQPPVQETIACPEAVATTPATHTDGSYNAPNHRALDAVDAQPTCTTPVQPSLSSSSVTTTTRRHGGWSIQRDDVEMTIHTVRSPPAERAEGWMGPWAVYPVTREGTALAPMYPSMYNEVHAPNNLYQSVCIDEPAPEGVHLSSSAAHSVYGDSVTHNSREGATPRRHEPVQPLYFFDTPRRGGGVRRVEHHSSEEEEEEAEECVTANDEQQRACRLSPSPPRQHDANRLSPSPPQRQYSPRRVSPSPPQCQPSLNRVSPSPPRHDGAKQLSPSLPQRVYSSNRVSPSPPQCQPSLNRVSPSPPRHDGAKQLSPSLPQRVYSSNRVSPSPPRATWASEHTNHITCHEASSTHGTTPRQPSSPTRATAHTLSWPACVTVAASLWWGISCVTLLSMLVMHTIPSRSAEPEVSRTRRGDTHARRRLSAAAPARSATRPTPARAESAATQEELRERDDEGVIARGEVQTDRDARETASRPRFAAFFVPLTIEEGRITAVKPKPPAPHHYTPAPRRTRATTTVPSQRQGGRPFAATRTTAKPPPRRFHHAVLGTRVWRQSPSPPCAARTTSVQTRRVPRTNNTTTTTAASRPRLRRVPDSAAALADTNRLRPSSPNRLSFSRARVETVKVRCNEPPTRTVHVTSKQRAMPAAVGYSSESSESWSRSGPPPRAEAPPAAPTRSGVWMAAHRQAAAEEEEEEEERRVSGRRRAATHAREGGVTTATHCTESHPPRTAAAAAAVKTAELPGARGVNTEEHGRVRAGMMPVSHGPVRPVVDSTAPCLEHAGRDVEMAALSPQGYQAGMYFSPHYHGTRGTTLPQHSTSTTHDSNNNRNTMHGNNINNINTVHSNTDNNSSHNYMTMMSGGTAMTSMSQSAHSAAQERHPPSAVPTVEELDRRLRELRARDDRYFGPLPHTALAPPRWGSRVPFAPCEDDDDGWRRGLTRPSHGNEMRDDYGSATQVNSYLGKGDGCHGMRRNHSNRENIKDRNNDEAEAHAAGWAAMTPTITVQLPHGAAGAADGEAGGGRLRRVRVGRTPSSTRHFLSPPWRTDLNSGVLHPPWNNTQPRAKNVRRHSSRVLV